VCHEHGKELYVGRVSECGAVQGMKDVALRCRPAGEGTKPPYAALAEDCRGERCGKGAPERVSGGDQGDGAQPRGWGRC